MIAVVTILKHRIFKVIVTTFYSRFFPPATNRNGLKIPHIHKLKLPHFILERWKEIILIKLMKPQ